MFWPKLSKNVQYVTVTARHFTITALLSPSITQFYLQDNTVSVQSINGYSARSDISDRQFDNREWVMVESDFKRTAGGGGGVVSFELRLSVKKK